MKLVSVYTTDAAPQVLYDLLLERTPHTWISHARMPTMEEHRAFIDSRPFWRWYLIQVGAQHVGAIEVTEFNEIGVAILLRYQGRGYGSDALRLFLDTHEPQPPIRAKRNARWLANIATTNEASKKFFERFGFAPIQTTYAL